MRRGFMTLGTIGCASAIAGCSIAGSWRTVSVEPPGVPFPVDALTLSSDRNYTATWSHEEETRTSTGRYSWNGFTLRVEETGRMPRRYGARLRLDGKLVLTHQQGEAKAVATLEKVKD